MNTITRHQRAGASRPSMTGGGALSHEASKGDGLGTNVSLRHFHCSGNQSKHELVCPRAVQNKAQHALLSDIFKLIILRPNFFTLFPVTSRPNPASAAAPPWVL